MDNLNLTPAINAIKIQINEIKNKYKSELKPYIDSISQLRKINKCCEYCNGTGSILRNRVCAEDDRPNPNDPKDYKPCPRCNGSGLSFNSEKDEDLWNIN